MTSLAIVLTVLIAYFVAPNWVENIAVKLLYPTVTIEDKYVNNFSVEIPQVYELMYIACSLTETFKNDDNLISSRTPEYLAEVNGHFSEFSLHPLVVILEEKLKENPYSQLQPAIRLFAMNYDLNKDNQLQNIDIFHVNPVLVKLFKSRIFYYPDYIDEIEDFAKQTDFYRFYEHHTTYYNTLKVKYQQLCELQKMWQWMEERF
ncbi:MAG: hypothetical protein AAFO07_13605, partial [Bacteroidota bacterium]